MSQLETFKIWWQRLSMRERWMVGCGGTVALSLLVYLFIWSPFTNAIDYSKSNLAYKQSLLQWMQQTTKQLDQLKQTGTLLQHTSTAQLLSVTDATLRSAKLNQYTLSIGQSGRDKVLVKFGKVPFDNFIQWLTQLWQHHGIKVDQLTLTPNKTISGMVKVDVVLDN